jgi:hypothetical protein
MAINSRLLDMQGIKLGIMFAPINYNMHKASINKVINIIINVIQ